MGFRAHNVAPEDDVGDIESEGTVTLSEDGQKMTGINDYGVRFTGIKQTPNAGTSCEQTMLCTSSPARAAQPLIGAATGMPPEAWTA